MSPHANGVERFGVSATRGPPAVDDGARYRSIASVSREPARHLTRTFGGAEVGATQLVSFHLNYSVRHRTA